MIAVYEYDRRTAEQKHEFNLWMFSGVENEYCRNAIEKFLQMKNAEKQEEKLCKIMESYGLDRMQWVLAFSIHANAEHFNEQAQIWAESIVPENYPMHEAQDWILHDHFKEIAALASGIARQMAQFRFLDISACSEKIQNQNAAGKLLILRPGVLGDSCKIREAQYFYSTESDEKNGSVKGYFLINGQKVNFRKTDFLGIADKKQLPEWAAKRLSEIQSPKMKIRVFQVDHNKDRKHLSFRSYDNTLKLGGVDSSVYRQIYGGTVNCSGVEDVFRLCEKSPPPGYYGQMPHVSDIIEICDGENKGFYFCDIAGFKPIDFDISQTDHDKMLRVLILESNKEPYIAEIQDSPGAKQSVVGGMTDIIRFDDIDEKNDAFIYCSREFLAIGNAPNRVLGTLLIHGTFMLVGEKQGENEMNIETSLTDEQIVKFTELFRYPAVSVPEQELTQSEEETEDFGFFPA